MLTTACFRSPIVSTSGFVVRVVAKASDSKGMHAIILQARDASNTGGAARAFGTFSGLMLDNETVEGVYTPLRCFGRVGDTMVWTTGTNSGLQATVYCTVQYIHVMFIRLAHALSANCSRYVLNLVRLVLQ